MAEDIAPSETVQMDKTKLLSFVTRLGSANSQYCHSCQNNGHSGSCWCEY